jgi:hypothetical protein
MMRTLSALWVASLLWLLAPNCSDPKLYELGCVENGEQCTGECCDPAAVCATTVQCELLNARVGVCVVPTEAGAR